MPQLKRHVKIGKKTNPDGSVQYFRGYTFKKVRDPDSKPKTRKVSFRKRDSVNTAIVEDVTTEVPEFIYVAKKDFGNYKQGDTIPADQVTIEMKHKKLVKRVELLLDNSSNVEVVND